MVGVVMSDEVMYIGFDKEFDPAGLDEPFETMRVNPSEVKRLAKEVMQGKHGRGSARQESLGELYVPVMDEVRRIRLQGA